MAIQTTNTAAQEFLKKAASTVPGTAKSRLDPKFFDMMLQSGYGINGQVSKAGKVAIPKENMISGLEMLSSGEASGNEAALSMLGYQSSAKGLTGAEAGMDTFQGNALATLSRMAMEQSASQIASTAAPAAAPENGSSLRRSVDKSAVRMAVSAAARHPDDLGHLSRVGQTSGRGGFTKREEELLLAAAGAENILAESSRVEKAKEVAATTRTVLPSTLEHKAGRLSAKYESNSEIDYIGYDSRGGTSYGQYQIASKTGTMDYFVRFLEDKAPDIAGKLKAAGPSDTGGRTGRMPVAWKAIAAADPKRFEALQHEFIRSNNYSPAAKSIVLTTGVDVTRRSYALREVLWSTAVQHGPSGAERIFTRAIEKADAMPAGQDFDKSVIEEVYRIRGQKFFRHNKRVREAVLSRFQNEKSMAIALLDGGTA
ncbi:VgrG-related protein [Solidesulfovibrio sp.]